MVINVDSTDFGGNNLVTYTGIVKNLDFCSTSRPVSITIFKCPDSQCEECLSYNSTAQWGVCTKCNTYGLSAERCKCGDNTKDSWEVCEDWSFDGMGCWGDCLGSLPGWTCTTANPSVCTADCGDGIIVDTE